MEKWKDNVFFTLVEPKEPGNIGASARAIKNMGFRKLCLVNPPPEMTTEGRWFARNAHDVLDAAQVFSSLKEAIRDKAIVVGTTRRKGKRRGMILPVEEGSGAVYRAALNNRVAVLFGREARGLFNEEVEECGLMMTIPSSRIQPSLNLAQAVLLTAYELSKVTYRPEIRNVRGEEMRTSLVSHDDLTQLYERISGVLQLLEYIPRGDRNLEKKIMTNLKHFIGRAGLTAWELNMLLGLCWQVEKKVTRR